MLDSTRLSPAYLFIGDLQAITYQAECFVKKVFCKQNGCTTCVICSQIERRQYHGLYWLKPENLYTVAQLEVIFATLAFSLNSDEHLFFVLERADALSITCANSLLKSLEEPPPGYHFILLAPSKDLLLPTITSRCLIYYFDHDTATRHTLVSYFTDFDAAKALDFAKELEQSKMFERDISSLLDAIYSVISQKYQERLLAGDIKKVIVLEKQIALLEHMLECLPMPGSSKIFLRNLFLQFSLCAT
jgi:DNA polymerase III subunit delta'